MEYNDTDIVLALALTKKIVNLFFGLDACLCLDGPPASNFLDSLDPGGGVSWTLARMGGLKYPPTLEVLET